MGYCIGWLIQRCECKIPETESIALVSIFFGYFLGSLFFAHRADVRFRRRYQLTCPECGAFFDKISLWKYSRSGGCPYCLKSIAMRDAGIAEQIAALAAGRLAARFLSRFMQLL